MNKTSRIHQLAIGFNMLFQARKNVVFVILAYLNIRFIYTLDGIEQEQTKEASSYKTNNTLKLVVVAHLARWHAVYLGFYI